MDRFDELKRDYESLKGALSAIGSEQEANDLPLYLVSAMLRIWGSNKLYSEDYKAAIKSITGKDYTFEQIVTAMRCGGEKGRTLSVPEFFVSFVKNGDEKTVSDYLSNLNEFLIAAAFINGDFTIEEANTITEITKDLVEYCHSRGFKDISLPSDIDVKTTPRKEESYLRKADMPANKDGATTDIQPETEPSASSEPITINFYNVEVNGGGGNGIISDSSEPDFLKETPATVTKPQEEKSEETMESLLEELDGLVGLESVKEDVHSLMNFIKVSKLRESRGMKAPTVSYHLVFTGNPGTGKTTVARLVAKLYYHMGILPQGQLVETDRSALVAGYLGQTAIKTQKVIQEAMGGVLFIDEAYSLANDAQDSYGKEAIETILKAMEDHRDELIVIVAGYDNLMHKFIDSNPGLSSRFSKYFHFPDYTGDEMIRIFQRFCKSNGYIVSDVVAEALKEKFCLMYETREEHFGNARTVRNIFEKAINCQANRVAYIPDISDEDLSSITQEDIDGAMKQVG